MLKLRHVDPNNAEVMSQFALHGVAAFIFDWDGVLVDSGRIYYRAYEMVLRDMGISITPREIYLREGQPTPQLIHALCAEHGIAVTDEMIGELVQRRRKYDMAAGKRTFFPGIWDMLSRLRSAGCKLGLVTGSSRRSVEVVLSPEKERCFDAIVTADDVTRPKPDPQPFTMAAERMMVHPSKCVVVENAPFGVQAARVAGCRVIALCTTLSPEDLQQADWVVLDHQALERLLSWAVQRSATEVRP